ncbi:hypothetical protein [Escherichia coli]|uniref:hypothetical protein n=1 Tax=Escherichia coli TaxID=562 RepID=UPI002035BE8B|nr:hypothetical protein [Escherichia coli]
MSVTDDVVVPATATATALLFPAALILTTAVLSCLPGAPSAPGCLAASGRQAPVASGAPSAPGR